MIFLIPIVQEMQEITATENLIQNLRVCEATPRVNRKKSGTNCGKSGVHMVLRMVYPQSQ